MLIRQTKQTINYRKAQQYVTFVMVENETQMNLTQRSVLLPHSIFNMFFQVH